MPSFPARLLGVAALQMMLTFMTGFLTYSTGMMFCCVLLPLLALLTGLLALAAPLWQFCRLT
jgi:hypothetical protein